MKVKTLEWIVRGKSVGPVVYAGAFGVTHFYSISGTEGDWTLSYPGTDCMTHVDGFGTQHSAREAAQSDYVARVSDAIDTDANHVSSSHSGMPTPPGNQIRTAECDGKDAVPVTGQLLVGTASPKTHAHGDLTGLKPIPIEAAKRIAKEYGYDQVLIYARRCHDTPEPHGEHMTTYGRNREHCDVAARMGDVLKKFMGWEI